MVGGASTTKELMLYLRANASVSLPLLQSYGFAGELQQVACSFF